jgi:predicted DNA-binding transcriptional regulator AlpA
VPEPLKIPAEVSAWLGVSERTLSDWRYRGIGPPFVSVGRHVRYRVEDVETWIDQQREPQASARGSRDVLHLPARATP